MTLGQIHVGDLSTYIEVLVQYTDINNVNQTQDLTAATSIQITIIDPDGNIIIDHATATRVNPPGADGLVFYITNGVTSLWNKKNIWKWFITYTIPAGTFSTNSALHDVLIS
jgi:hypothetical protein